MKSMLSWLSLGWFKAAASGLLLVCLYFSAYTKLMELWQREDFSYCYLIPLVVVYLLWEKRSVLRKTASRPTWLGLLPMLLGIGFFWLGELSGEYSALFLSSWLVLIGLCWMQLGSRKVRVILFPLAFILTMFPPPRFLFNTLSLQLKLISSRLGVNILQMAGMSAYREGNVIDLGFTQLQVVDACSGLRYLIPLTVLAVLVAYLSKSALWKKIVLVLSAIPISIVVNSARIASVGMLYPIWGKDAAEGFFHDFSGWLIFIFSLAILLGELALLNKVFRTRQEKHASDNIDQAAALKTPDIVGNTSVAPTRRAFQLFPLPFIVAILCLTVTLVLVQGIDFHEKTSVNKPFHLFPMQVGQWSGRFRTLEPRIVRELDFSDYMVAEYTNAQRRSVNFYTAFYESQRKGESIHSPESCLPGGGWVFEQSGDKAVALSSQGRTITVNRALVQQGPHRQLIYYWFPCRGRILTHAYQLKLYTFWDALTRQRTDGALVRVTTPLYAGEDLSAAEERLQGFVQAIVPLLDEFLPG